MSRSTAALLSRDDDLRGGVEVRECHRAFRRRLVAQGGHPLRLEAEDGGHRAGRSDWISRHQAAAEADELDAVLERRRPRPRRQPCTRRGCGRRRTSGVYAPCPCCVRQRERDGEERGLRNGCLASGPDRALETEAADRPAGCGFRGGQILPEESRRSCSSSSAPISTFWDPCPG